ncbi:MAG: chemotaxis protein CheW [Myxococcales bacterium]|jgi:purine-binding chemotaxis protein CheW|nr:chemotaxis protein CheW [Myxococcales bacterium]MDH3844953.1 chemotaxis protein CheW [Myxococcales bacterium]
MSAAQKATLAPEPDSDTGAVAVLGVRVGNEAYGVPLASVREILVPPPMTEVPRAANHFLGVISVRGEIITVIDLAKLLNLEVVNDEPHGRVLLVDNGQELIGVAVHRVIQVYRLEPRQIEYASVMSADLSDYVVGVGRVQDHSTGGADDVLILIDPVSLLGE